MIFGVLARLLTIPARRSSQPPNAPTKPAIELLRYKISGFIFLTSEKISNIAAKLLKPKRFPRCFRIRVSRPLLFSLFKSSPPPPLENRVSRVEIGDLFSKGGGPV